MCFHSPSITCLLKRLLASCRHLQVFFLKSDDAERVKETIQTVSWASEMEAVNVATLRKDNQGTTLIPVHVD